jgi:formate/nitrite transporter
MTEQPRERAGAHVDALLPRDIAIAAERVGEAKAALDATSLFMLAVLAGAFVALGAMFSTTTLAGAGAMPFGVARLLAGVAFSLGLVMVLVGGAELFTGDSLMVMALAARQITPRALIRAWAIIYFGNFVGASGTAVLVFLAGHHEFGAGEVGRVVLGIAEDKVRLPLGRAVMLGVLCNVLVCLAVWLSLGARGVADKVLVIVPPITAFVAAGFEHSVANMYYLPFGLLLKWGAAPAFWTAIGASPTAYDAVGVASAFANLAAVTIGNVIGGAGLVGLIYWFIYLRPRRP